MHFAQDFNYQLVEVSKVNWFIGPTASKQSAKESQGHSNRDLFHKGLGSWKSKSRIYSCFSHKNDDDHIRSQICTYHNSSAVVIYANFLPDRTVKIKINAWEIFTHDFNYELINSLWKMSHSLASMQTKHYASSELSKKVIVLSITIHENNESLKFLKKSLRISLTRQWKVSKHFMFIDSVRRKNYQGNLTGRNLLMNHGNKVGKGEEKRHKSSLSTIKTLALTCKPCSRNSSRSAIQGTAWSLIKSWNSSPFSWKPPVPSTALSTEKTSRAI